MSHSSAKQFVAEATDSGVEVLIQHSAHPDDTSPLISSSGGFEWGYEGAGPLSLAHAILANVVADRFCQPFMKDIIATTSPIEKHERVVVFHEADILKWLKGQLNKCELCA
jgi:hypothetical protein